jgi:hypothetical protein
MRHRRLLLKTFISVLVMIGVVVAFLRIAGQTATPALKQQLAIDGPIDGDELVMPIMVDLDFQDRPMSEVLQVLSVRTGCPLRIYELRNDWLDTRITIHEPAPLLFWQAVDRVCAVGGFQSNLGMGGISFFRDEIAGPTSDYGAFRVQLQDVTYNGRYRSLHLKRPMGTEGKDGEDSVINLHIMVEPRIMIRNDGDLKNLTVVDDLGQSLLPANPQASQPHYAFGFTPAAHVLGQIPLKRIDRPGTLIRKLQGVAPVAVATRRPKPLIIPLAGASGRTFDSGESVLTIRRVKKLSPNPKVTFQPVDPAKKALQPKPITPEATGIELTIRPPDGRPTIDGRGSHKPAFSQLSLSLSEHQFEVVDAAGQVWTLDNMAWKPM